MDIQIDLKVASWNIRGLNIDDKQKEIKKLISEEKLHLLTILENHVKDHRIKKVCDNIFDNWEYCSSRWDRKSLWSSLKDHKYIVNGSPWAITSDFNVTLVVNEHSNGSSSFSNDMKESQECTAEVEIKDINS
ncbi:RNA-directed DNA polymerase, eukaryota, reverse transcriptase zinc-binding domain protein [Tanacetum coccineum]